MSRYIRTSEYIRKRDWCDRRGWTEPFFQDNRWYAFPPNAVIPQPIPRTRHDYFFVIWNVLWFLVYRGLILLFLYTIFQFVQ